MTDKTHFRFILDLSIFRVQKGGHYQWKLILGGILSCFKISAFW
jgi:hypothetical protein